MEVRTGDRSPGTGVANVCEQCVGVENQTQVLCKKNKCSYLPSHPSSPQGCYMYTAGLTIAVRVESSFEMLVSALSTSASLAH